MSKVHGFFNYNACAPLPLALYLCTYERRLNAPVLFIVNPVDDDAADDLHGVFDGQVVESRVVREFCQFLAEIAVVL